MKALELVDQSVSEQMDFWDPLALAPSFSAGSLQEAKVLHGLSTSTPLKGAISPSPHVGCKHATMVLAPPHPASPGAVQLL